VKQFDTMRGRGWSVLRWPTLGLAIALVLSSPGDVEPRSLGAQRIRELLERVNQRQRDKLYRLALAITTSGSRQDTEVYQLDVVWAMDGTDAATLARIGQPPELAGVTLLLRESETPRLRNRAWVYLATSMPMVFEVADRAWFERVLGSEFTYHDLQRTIAVSDYDWSCNETGWWQGKRYLICTAVPRARVQALAGPGRERYWIDLERLEVARVQCFSATGILQRTLDVQEWTTNKGHWIPRRRILRDYTSQRTSVMALSEARPLRAGNSTRVHWLGSDSLSRVSALGVGVAE